MLISDGYVIGIEIGGRQRRVALATTRGETVAEEATVAPLGAPASEIDIIELLVDRCLASASVARSRVVRIGCGFSGPVDVSSGIVLRSHRQAGWDDLPLANLLEERLGATTLVDNDARVAALGEARFGAGRGEPHVVYVHLGTGLGGGLVIDGRLYHGATTTAGEIGHLQMSDDGPLCSCGKPGHLEAYASGAAIVQRALALASETAPDGPLLRCVGSGDQPTPALIFACAREGDPAAQRVIGEAIHYLSIALANLVTTVNPGIIVVGGRVSEAGPLLFEPLRSNVRRYAMAVPARAVRIVPAALHDAGIIVGAVALALQSLT